MKRNILLSLTLMAAAATGAFAQTPTTIQALDRIAEGACVSFDYTYWVASGQNASLSQTSEGTVTAQRDAYVVTGLGLEVRSDEKTRWSIDPAAKEVLIESVADVVAEDLFLTPTLAVCRYQSFFSPKFVGRTFVSDGFVDRFDLTLKAGAAQEYSEVYLLVMTDDESDPEKVRLSFGFKGSDATWVEIRTGELSFTDAKPLDFYRPAANAFSGKEWIVTDLR